MSRKHQFGVLYPNIEVLCFDGDGTLWNTEELLFQVHSEMLADRGHTLTEEVYRRIIGQEALKAATIMIETFGLKEEPEAYRQERRDRTQGRLSQVGLMPGVARALVTLKKSGAPFAIVSSAQESHVMTIAEAHGIRQFFRLFVTSDTPGLAALKPDPAPYKHAAEHFRVKAYKCVAFEDTAHGAKSARDAGMIVVGVPHRFSPREELQPVAHYVIPEGQTLGDFDLRHIQQWLPQ